MGFLIAATRSQSGEELKSALRGVRVIGDVRKSGHWWWTLVFHLHFKEVHEALASYETCSLSAYAGDSVWKLSLFGLNQTPFSLWFDASLASQHGVEKAKAAYKGDALKLARQFGLSGEVQKLFRALAFEEAVPRLLDLQLVGILDALQRYSIPHDPKTIREILLNPTSDELDSELCNLPRFLEGIELTGLFDR